jgi:hypothetical protein
MSYEEKSFWLFTGSCSVCEERVGVWETAPGRPHENCSCEITEGEAKVELVATREEIFDQYELLEDVGHVPKGGQLVTEQNWSTGTSTSGSAEVSGEVGGVGVSVGGEHSRSSSEGGSNSVTFTYDEEEGGDSQMVVARYEVTVYVAVNTYRAHWSEGMGPDFEFESYGETREERYFAGYDQIGF